MKRIILLLSGIFLISFSNSCNNISEIDTIRSDFYNPPKEAGVRCWWWWLNSNVTKQSITQDLEAMNEKGFSGAMIFDAGTELHWGPDSPPPNGPMFSGPEWTELFIHALNEANRLGLKLGLSIQSGWNLGGPNVSLDDAAKQICWSEITVKGNKKVSEQLPVPAHNHNYYRDIAVLAFPHKDNSQRLPIQNLSAKSGAHELGGSAPDCRFLLDDHEATRNEEDTRIEDIIDISDKLNKDGLLDWEAPAGQWTVMRFGYTPTLTHVKTSSDNWKGHVLDYLNKEVFNRYWDEIVDPLLQKAGPMAGTVLTHLETDSWECGGMNWSPDFAEYFNDYNGYDIMNYLPVVAGKIINTRGQSNSFLADLRKTIAACVSENHYKTFAERAAEYGMGIQPESAGPHAAPIDGITNYSHSDIMMSEFWVPSPHRPNPQNRFFVKQAASAAHIYGKQFVGAESFTSIRKPHWGPVLWKEQKPSMDHEFCSGLNMIFFHTYTNSPDEMGEPGQEYFAGTHINRHVTWWDMSDPFMDYIKRVQYVLQKGTFVADVLYYYGDHVPNIARLKEDDPAGVLPGYDYDITNEEILLKLKVENGKVVVPSGLSYRLLALPDHEVLSLAALKKVHELLQEGATVLGPKPKRLVSLKGGDEAQKEFHKLATELWGITPPPQGYNSIGSGHLLWGATANEFLRFSNVPRDFDIVKFKTIPQVDYIHYTIDNSDVYFVSNQTDKAAEFSAQLRVTGKKPEIWDPINGKTWMAVDFEETQTGTTIPLKFDPYGSVILVFSELSDKEAGRGNNFPELVKLAEVNNEWEVSFDKSKGGPGTIKTDGLFDWTESKENGIRYYSGTAEYSTSFAIENLEKNQNYWIQLNKVEDVGIASVEINGALVGTVWTPPFRLEISDALKKGENKLIIKVVNNWQNRLIGERDGKTKEKITKTNLKIKKEWEIQSSGLLGPVEIYSTKNQ